MKSEDGFLPPLQRRMLNPIVKIGVSLILLCWSPVILQWIRTVERKNNGMDTNRRQQEQHEQFLSSAFANELYPSIFEEPFRSYPCMPKRIHITQSINVHEQHQEQETTTRKRWWWSSWLGFKEIQPQPEQIVSMILSFTVANEPICESIQPIVLYGRKDTSWWLFPSQEETSRTTGSSTIGSTNMERLQFQYASPLTDDNETYTSDWIYHVTLTNLKAGLESYWYRIQIFATKPATTTTTDGTISATFASTATTSLSVTNEWFYYYLRGRKRILGETPAFEFRTPPTIGSPCTLALVGDLGQTENSTKTMNHIFSATKQQQQQQQRLFNHDGNDITTTKDQLVSTLLLAGDLSYSDGDPNRWERWLEVMEPLLRSLSMETAAGNHEIECDRITHDVFVPYEHYFRNPNRNSSVEMKPVPDEYWNRTHYCTTPSQYLGHYNNGNSYYSFLHGIAHVIVLNSYTDTTVGSVQYQWLQRTLEEQVDRTITPWLIVMFHCPLHTTFVSHVNEINPSVMLENMEPLFVKHTVNIILSGHDHAFMRTYPMIGRKLDVSHKGPVYLTLGAGGNREEHSRAYIHPNASEVWVAKRDRFEYGYGKLYLANATHAHFQWVRDGTTTEGAQDDVWLSNQLLVTAEL